MWIFNLKLKHEMILLCIFKLASKKERKIEDEGQFFSFHEEQEEAEDLMGNDFLSFSRDFPQLFSFFSRDCPMIDFYFEK